MCSSDLLVVFGSQAYWHDSCLIRRSRAFGDARDYVTFLYVPTLAVLSFLCAYGAVGRQ